MLVVFIDIRPCKEKDMDQLIQTYQSVFAEPPWNEYMKCGGCGINYGKDEVVERETFDNRGDVWFVKEPKIIDKENSLDFACKQCEMDLSTKFKPSDGSFSELESNFIPFWSYENIKSDIEYALKQDGIRNVCS